MRCRAFLNGVSACAAVLVCGATALAQHARFFDKAHAEHVSVHPDLLDDNGVGGRGAIEGPCRTVFGFLPYWVSDANVRYDHLTHVAAFAVEVNSNGTLGNDHGWPWTGAVNRAHAGGAKVLLTATLFDSNALLALVTSPSRRSTFQQAIRDKILEGNADGVCIDFEGGTSNGWPTYMPAFMGSLRSYLHQQIPGSTVAIATPAVNWGSHWPLPLIADASDIVFIMGYDFYGSWSSTSGPSAPLRGGTYNITNTLTAQYAGVDTSKLVLGVPYYGNRWTTTGSLPYAPVSSWNSSLTYAAEQSTQYGQLWDATSQTAWYRWDDGTSWHQAWIDNSESLGMKFDLADQSGLQGVGMWALGYDGSRPEYWGLINDRYRGAACIACPHDLDGSGAIEIFDLLTFLVDWFADDADWNESGGTDVFDLLAYLEGWFAGC